MECSFIAPYSRYGSKRSCSDDIDDIGISDRATFALSPFHTDYECVDTLERGMVLLSSSQIQRSSLSLSISIHI